PHLQQQRAPTPTTQRNLDVQMAATIEQSPSTAVTALPSAGQLLATHNFIQNQLQCIDDFLAPWMAVRFHLLEADRNICIIQSRATSKSSFFNFSLFSSASRKSAANSPAIGKSTIYESSSAQRQQQQQQRTG